MRWLLFGALGFAGYKLGQRRLAGCSDCQQSGDSSSGGTFSALGLPSAGDLERDLTSAIDATGGVVAGLFTQKESGCGCGC